MHPPTHKSVLSLRGYLPDKEMYSHWVETGLWAFFRRNPEIKTKIGGRINQQRVNGASPAKINEFLTGWTPSTISPLRMYGIPIRPV